MGEKKKERDVNRKEKVRKNSVTEEADRMVK